MRRLARDSMGTGLTTFRLQTFSGLEASLPTRKEVRTQQEII